MRLLSSLILLVMLGACDSREVSKPLLTCLEESGHRESFRYRSDMVEAVARANTLLGPGMPVRLYPSWRGVESGMVPVFDPDGGFSLALAIPVFLVDGDSLPKNHIVFVPSAGRCIFVNVESLLTLFQMFSAGWSDSDAPSHEYERTILTFALMHEAGHLFYGDVGSFFSSDPVSLEDILAVSLSFEDIQAGRVAHLNQELRADLFVLDHVKKSSRGVAGVVEASRIQMLFFDAAFNLAGERVTKHYGDFGVGRRALFQDTSYSHPNLELRMLVLCYLASPSVAGEELLRSFLSERNAPRIVEPLFVRPKLPRQTIEKPAVLSPKAIRKSQ